MENRRDVLKAIGATGAALFGANWSVASIANITNKQNEMGQPGTTGPYGFKYFVGVVGNPSLPDVSWSDEQLQQITSLGINMVQLNLAWGGRPAGEAINLEDMDEEQKRKFVFRIAQAKKFGLKTMAHFGVPRMLNFSPVRPACILDPKVQQHYVGLISDFMKTFPGVDDFLIYTYDQQAWICSEYGPCPRCSGIPIADRLPSFLNMLKTEMSDHSPTARLWWKPWELTKGQTQAIVASISANNFGLVLNPSTSNEVYPFNDRSFSADLGVKRLVQMAVDRNIPVIGEFDHTLYKGLYLVDDYCPRFVYEQLQGWRAMKGVIGIKEYYGFSPALFSVNTEMLRLCIKYPNESFEQLVKRLGDAYGKKASALMIKAWEKVAQGVECIPWDTTYLLSAIGLSKENNGSHSWLPVTIANATWNTPIWKVNRRANFMLTEEHKAHPWLFEDAGLRLDEAAALYFEAALLMEEALTAGPVLEAGIRIQRDSLLKTARALRGISLHFLETLAAQDARMVAYDEQQFEKVIARLEKYLLKDLENQQKDAAMQTVYDAFISDPKKWLDTYLNPRTYESVCSVDWSQYVSYQQ